MIHLSPEFCFQVKAARRSAGLSQSILSREVGCTQSALSMFEQGDGTKLSEETVQKLAKKFNLTLPAAKSASPVASMPALAAQVLADFRRGFCPNPLCPSHSAYEVEGRRLLKPDLAAQDPAHGKYCAVCGELLERRCPTCGASVHEGAICTHCGNPYLPLIDS